MMKNKKRIRQNKFKMQKLLRLHCPMKKNLMKSLVLRILAIKVRKYNILNKALNHKEQNLVLHKIQI